MPHEFIRGLFSGSSAKPLATTGLTSQPVPIPKPGLFSSASPRTKPNEPVRFDPVTPELIKEQIQVESGGNPKAVNKRSGAIGLLQLRPATARELGVDPHDPVQNVEGGTRYLRQQFKDFKSVSINDEDNARLALMAFNWGPHRVQHWLNSGRKSFVPPETINYVKNLLPFVGQRRGTVLTK